MIKQDINMTHSTKQRGIIPIILVVIIALAAVGGGAWVYKQNKDKKISLSKQPDRIEESGQKVPDKNSPAIFDLQALNNSGQSGTFTLTPLATKAESDEAAQVKVEIELELGIPGTAQPVHIHTGLCSLLGDVKYPLANVENGKSVTVLKISIDELMSQLPLAVNIHKSAAEAKTYVSCGNIIGAEPSEDDMNMIQKDLGPIMTKKPGLSVSPVSGDEAGTIGPRYSGEILAGSDSAPLLDFNKSDLDVALKTDSLIVLYFYANWCPVCRAEFPKMVEAFDELGSDKVIGFRVNYNDSDTDNDEKELARQHGVAYQHTKVFVKDGERIGKWPDGCEKNRYLNEINRAL